LEPADFADENTYRLSIGSFLSCNTSSIFLPTIPVAPTTAILIFFIPNYLLIKF